MKELRKEKKKMSEERFKDALNQIANMDLGPRVKEIIRRAFHPDEPCHQCQGKGEVPNTSKWCVFEEEGPMTLKCLKFNKYVQNSNICSDCDGYTAKYPKMTCPSCDGKKEKVVIATEQVN
jgi:DnaJ-class molecular chaperone